MTPVLTGRSILKFLHTNGGESSVTALASTLDSDPVAVDRLVQSLLAAKLVSRSDDQLVLSVTGSNWCKAEFKAPSSEAKPAAPEVSVPPASIASAMPVKLREELSKPVREVLPASRSGKSNRMHGVQVVHAKRRRDAPASIAKLDIVEEKTVQPVIPVPQPEPVKVPQPESAKVLRPEPAKVPEPKPVKAPESKPAKVPETRPVKAPESKPAKVPETKPVKAPEPEPVKQVAVAETPRPVAQAEPRKAAPQPELPLNIEPVATAESGGEAAKPKRRTGKKSASKVVVDDDGFVTHINGRKIF
jgi:hypothetical protein